MNPKPFSKLPDNHEIKIYRPNPASGKPYLESQRVRARDLGLTGRQFKKMQKAKRKEPKLKNIA